MARALERPELLDTGARDRARSAYESARENEAAVLAPRASGTAASAHALATCVGAVVDPRRPPSSRGTP